MRLGHCFRTVICNRVQRGGRSFSDSKAHSAWWRSGGLVAVKWGVGRRRRRVLILPDIWYFLRKFFQKYLVVWNIFRNFAI